MFNLSGQEVRDLIEPVLDAHKHSDAEIRNSFALAYWNLIADPGDADAVDAVDERGAAGALEEFLGFRVDDPGDEAAARWRKRANLTALRRSLATAAHVGAKLIALPPESRFSGLGQARPLALWAIGDARLIVDEMPRVTLTGARACTGYGEHVADELAGCLSGAGVAVVSGGSYGIDSAAHRAALGVGGKTVAYLAGGIDRFYPAGHQELLKRVASLGAVVSEAAPDAAPSKHLFLQRDRLLAAASDATVVVEAGPRSGALHTAGIAKRLGRPVGAVPGPVTSPASDGTRRLLRESGATAVGNFREVLELAGIGSDGRGAQHV